MLCKLLWIYDTPLPPSGSRIYVPRPLSNSTSYSYNPTILQLLLILLLPIREVLKLPRHISLLIALLVLIHSRQDARRGSGTSHTFRRFVQRIGESAQVAGLLLHVFECGHGGGGATLGSGGLLKLLFNQGLSFARLVVDKENNTAGGLGQMLAMST